MRGASSHHFVRYSYVRHCRRSHYSEFSVWEAALDAPFAGRESQLPPLIMTALSQNTAGNPNALATNPNAAGPSTRTPLLTLCRNPRISPERPRGVRPKISIVVIGW